MLKKELYERIKKENKILQFSEIEEFVDVHRVTLTRWLLDLQKKGLLEKKKEGKNTYYSIPTKISVLDYLRQEKFRRKPVVYNPDFLRSYDPMKESFLGDMYKEKLLPIIEQLTTLGTHDYLANRRGIESMLIDISYQSSKLEGNTYTYLDTEVLLKYHESAKDKSNLDAQMILNHKDAIEYCIEQRNNLLLSKKTFCEIHTFLGAGLLQQESLGVFRNMPIEIGGSTYQPLEAGSLLEGEFQLFLEKLNQIANPFEQSFFILVFIPYFQSYLDINKRTSRIMANLPLIKAGYPVISLLEISPRDYIDAILAIYELNDISLLRDIFVENYIRNVHRYVIGEDLQRLYRL